MSQQKQPTIEEIFAEFHFVQNKANNIMEMFYKQLKQNFQEIQQKDLIIGNLQKKIQEIQPNAKKPVIKELPKSNNKK